MRRWSMITAVLLLADRAAGLVPRPKGAQGTEEERGRAAARGDADGSRPMRRGSGVFDSPAAAADGATASATTASASEAAGQPGAPVASDVPAASEQWQAANEAILSDMRAHLKRRRKKEKADLIGRGPIGQIVDFFGSKYFRNVRKSAGVFFGAWLWYVLNTKTYVQPEYDD